MSRFPEPFVGYDAPKRLYLQPGIPPVTGAIDDMQARTLRLLAFLVLAALVLAASIGWLSGSG